MYWHDYNKEPPKSAGLYEVLMLVCNGIGEKMWWQTQGIYNTNNKMWTILVDGNEWCFDVGTPYYYFKTPELPPIPYEGPICEYLYGGDYCSAQKNMPRCYCQGDKNKCECKENFSYD